MTNRKILIVDDDSELREALVEQLALHEEYARGRDEGIRQVVAARELDAVIGPAPSER
jgi:CheY-like chemotaxis protein